MSAVYHRPVEYGKSEMRRYWERLAACGTQITDLQDRGRRRRRRMCKVCAVRIGPRIARFCRVECRILANAGLWLFTRYEAVKASRVPVCVPATDSQGCLMVLRLDGKDKAEIKQALRDTGRLPLVAHSLKDERVLRDGALSGHNMPLEVAAGMGATHVIILGAGTSG